MTVIGCANALAVSQIVPLLYLTLATTISRALDAADLVVWLFSAIIVAMGALAPFVGPLADMFGCKIIFLIGFVLSVAGSILSVVTPNAAGFIAGQVLLGFGAVIQELFAVAVWYRPPPRVNSMYGADKSTNAKTYRFRRQHPHHC
jgi:MFS family permease